MTTYLDHFQRTGIATSLPSGERGGNLATICTHSWTEHTRLNLAQHYGSERADAILSGKDPKTQMDLIRWRQLGQRSAA